MEKTLFDEQVFNDDIFSAEAIKQRESMIEEKKRLFEETETQEFKKNKEEMRKRLEEGKKEQEKKAIEGDKLPIEEISDLSIKEEEDEILTDEEIEHMVAESNNHKEKGNEFFRETLWEAAISEYTKAINACPRSQSVRSIYFGNRAACWLNLHEFQKTIDDCTEALKYDSKYVKVLVRRAEAYEKLDKLSEAYEGNILGEFIVIFSQLVINRFSR